MLSDAGNIAKLSVDYLDLSKFFHPAKGIIDVEIVSTRLESNISIFHVDQLLSFRHHEYATKYDSCLHQPANHFVQQYYGTFHYGRSE